MSKKVGTQQEVAILVLMSTYNGERYLQEQLESIFAQKKVWADILIRDDGSTDATTDLIREAMQRYPGRIFFVQGANVGYARSFTMLLEMAEKKYPNYHYYAFSDQDDVWLPWKLHQAVLKLDEEKEKHPNTALGYCSNLTCVDAEQNVLKSRIRKEVHGITGVSILLRPMCTGCTMVFNLKAIQLYVDYKHSYLKYHDFLMGLICFYLGQLVYDNNSYIYYRQHGTNQIGAKLSFSQRMLNRLHHLKRKESNIIENICKDFLCAYREILPADKLRNLVKVAYYRKGINRWNLLFSKDTSMNSFEDSFFLKCKILFGRL